MKRREFIALLGGAGTLPFCARAEGVQLRRIAVLVAIAENDPEAPRRISALRGGLQERGWVNNIHLETRFSAGSGERLRAYAAKGRAEVLYVVGDPLANTKNGCASIRSRSPTDCRRWMCSANMSKPAV